MEKGSERMASKRKIGAIIALDGEREFKAAVTSCNKSLATMRSEMKLVEAETAGSANSLETLQKKQQVLSGILDEHRKKEREIQKGLEHSRKEYNRVENTLDEYRASLQIATKALEEMENSGYASEEILKEQRKTVETLNNAIQKGEKTYETAASRIKEWEKQLNNAKAQTLKASGELEKNTVYLKEAEQATDHCAKSIDNFGKDAEKATEVYRSFKDIVREKIATDGIDLAKDAMKSLIGTGVSGATELQDAQKHLQASIGLTAKETEKYGAVMEGAYKNGYGDSVEELSKAMGTVAQYTHETDPEKIRELTENALALSDTFDMDMNESIRGVQALMENMGLSAEEAFDYITKGAQNGLDKSGELTDNIAEYAQLWGQAGFSAEEMFTILQNGLDSGAYNLDKVNDFVKEFGISLSDGRIEENISSFSVETKNLFKQWKNGQASTKQVFTSIVNDLGSMTNEQEALTLASNVWSALGEDNAMKVITSLNDANDAYKDVKGSMEDLKNVKYDSLTNKYKTLGRTFQTEVAAPIIKEFLPAAEKGIEFLTEHTDEIIPVATAAGVAMGTIFAVKKTNEIISEVTTLGEHLGILTAKTTIHTAATETAAAAHLGLNAAILANPATLVVGGIVALTAAVAVLAGDSKNARDATYELVDAADAVNESAGKAAEALDKSTEGIETTVSDHAASEKTAHRLVDELESLRQKTKLTTAEQGRMHMVVRELNTMFPEMGLEIDSVTGKLSMGKEEIREYINSSLEMAKIEAVQKAIKESTEKLVDAEIEQTKAEQQLKDTTDALSAINDKRLEADQAVIDKQKEKEAAVKALSDAEKRNGETTEELMAKVYDTSEAQIEYNGVLMDVSEAYQVMAQDEELLTKKKEEQEEAQKKLNDSVTAAQEEINTYSEYVDANTDSTEGNTDAKNANADAAARQQEAADLSIEKAGQELEVYNQLSQGQQTLATEVTNSVLTMQENVQGALESQMNMFEEFNAGTEITKDQILANMQSQVDGVLGWEQNMNTLMTEMKTTSDGTQVAISEGLMQYLASMGPEGSTYMQQFVNMSGDELKKANELWEQSVDIKSMSNGWGQDLTQAIGELAAGGTESWNELAGALNMKASESGKYVVKGLVEGMQNAQKQAADEGSDLGIKTIEAVNKGAGVASPSTKTKQSGVFIVAGLTGGIKTSQKSAKEAGTDLGQLVTTAIRNALASGKRQVVMEAAGIGTDATRAVKKSVDTDSIYNSGLNLSYGLANGISAGRSSVINAVAEMCTAAVRQANESLDIHSPSRVFEKIGVLSAMGLPVGFKKKTPDVEREIRNSMKLIAGNSLNMADISGTMVSGEHYGSLRDGSGYSGNITVTMPIYLNGVLNRTEVEKISMEAVNKNRKGFYASKGVRVFA